MEVRKFRAASIQEATNMVKQRLGSDALILSTQRLNKKDGVSAQSGPRMFEICAVAGDRSRDLTTANPLDPASFDDLKSDLMSIKEMLFLLSRSGGVIRGLGTKPGAIDLYAKMVRGGIAESNAHGFLKQGGAFDENAESGSGSLHERVVNEILKVIDVTDPFDQSDEQVVAAFVGPTGVGKTTTIAKLVANLMLKQKKTVGLISIDNYRIGAMEQLKTYAAILGVACFPAFSRADLEFALNRLKEKDVILIDTAGQSHYDLTRMQELAELIRSDNSIKCHLLLSAGISESEMNSAAKNFGRLKPTSYIFSKADETRARGGIINQVIKLRMPISFVTTGQRVPEDILKATKTGILSLVFQ